MKKLICVVAALVLLLSLSLTAAAESEQYTIGIAQFAEHGSLDNCREGFLMGLAEAGIVEGENLTIDYQNAQADMGIANQIAQQFVSNNVDLMCAIATPVAQACYNAADGNIPTIYTAVTDPVAAMLAGEDGSPVGNATGTSDKLPVENQLKAIRAIMPEAKKIGILYTTSEVNSESAIAEYQALAPEYGFEIVTSGISTTSDIPMALDSLLSQVDVMTNLTDNTVVSALSLVLDKANAASIPVFGSEIEQVKLGCVASEGLDYIALGKQTGAMAAKVLKGEATCQDLPYEVISESSLYVNYEAMEALGLTLPEDMAARAIDVNAEAAAE
ncbi:MAG TPA: ABC transporter substrate-binding protein [Candidatus Faecaligallichristensenella faecipullorum]|nr:ABC transporter substrate-binding protein [Candidatus Faecaligallichristensenella faecipullorum]